MVGAENLIGLVSLWFMVAEVELTMRAIGDEWCCEPKNGLVALVYGKRELRVGRERVMGNNMRGIEGVKVSG